MLTIEEIAKNLKRCFEMGEYDIASQIVEEIRKKPELYNDVVAIYDANLCLMKGDYEQMWEAVQKGLSYNCKNAELYVCLGEYYLTKNPNQAYLCFENALFYCENEDDRVQIQAYMKELKETYKITVRNTSFIILSYNLLEYTKNCIESIRENTLESSREIVVVDNASKDDSVEWLREQSDVILRANTENSGFPKGCNEGVEFACKENDIFLLNNDTLVTPNALFWLRMGLYADESHGATSSVTNIIPNSQEIFVEDTSTKGLMSFAEKNNIPVKYPYEEKLYLAGFALLIRRDVYDKVGDLDERFSPGNFEDNDYGVRVILAGYKNILCRNSFIIHFGSKSFGKDESKHSSILQVNRKKFEEKWGWNFIRYSKFRPEIVKLIAEDLEKPLKILDIGCACGAMCAYLRSHYPNAITYGVEINKTVAKVAQHMTNAICADIENMEYPWQEAYFDYIIMGDILEYLHEPKKVLQKLKKYLKPNGHMIVSVPNVKHYTVLLPLLIDDKINYTDYGVLNTEQLKIYSCTETECLIVESGYEIETRAYTTYGEPNEKTNAYIDFLMTLSDTKDKIQYLTYQYIIKATPV